MSERRDSVQTCRQLLEELNRKQRFPIDQTGGSEQDIAREAKTQASWSRVRPQRRQKLC